MSVVAWFSVSMLEAGNHGCCDLVRSLSVFRTAKLPPVSFLYFSWHFPSSVFITNPIKKMLHGFAP